MFSAGLGWNEQQKNEIHRNVVNCVIGYGPGDPCEKAEHVLEPLDSRVRKGEAASKTCGAKRFTSLYRQVDVAGVEFQRRRGARGKIAKQLVFVGRLRGGDDLGWFEVADKIHECVFRCAERVKAIHPGANCV